MKIRRELIPLGILMLLTSVAHGMLQSQEKKAAVSGGFIVPKSNLKYSSVVHNPWYTKIDTQDDGTSAYERTLVLASRDKEVIRVSYDTKGRLLSSTIIYKAIDPESNTMKTVWKIKKQYNQPLRCQVIKPCLCILTLALFLYGLYNGPVYRQTPI